MNSTPAGRDFPVQPRTRIYHFFPEAFQAFFSNRIARLVLGELNSSVFE